MRRTAGTPMTAVIVDDHPVIVEVLTEILCRRGMFVAGTAGTAKDGLDLCRALSPAVVVVDLHLPDMDGLLLVEEVGRGCPATIPVVVTGDSSPETIEAATRAGAYAVLQKTEELHALADVICEAAAAARKVTLLRPGEAPATPAPAAAARGTAALGGLSGRQRSLLALLAEGLSNKDVARRLGTTEGVVKNYVSRLMADLGAHSRTQLALIAAGWGLCTSEASPAALGVAESLVPPAAPGS